MDRIYSLLVFLSVGIAACGGGSDTCTPTEPGCDDQGGDGSNNDGTYALQSVQGLVLPATVEGVDGGTLVFTDGSIVLGQGRTWNLTINFTQDGNGFVLRQNGVYEAAGTDLTFHCGDSATFGGSIQSGVLQLAYDQDCDGQVDLTLTFGPPPLVTNGIVGTYALYAMGICEIGGDYCGLSTPLTRLPYSIGLTFQTTYHAGALTLRADGTWELRIETTGAAGRGVSIEVGEYTTSGNDIKLIRDGCTDIPHLGTLQGTELRLVYNNGCDTVYDMVMVFRK